MLTHVMVGTNDLEKSKQFYDAVLGTLAVATLIAHTGLRLGHNLNLYLMLSFIGLLLVGGIASGVIGLQHLLPRGMAKRARELSLWLHIVFLWPLPVEQPWQETPDPLPDPDAFIETLRRLGISNDSRVVAYDDGSGGD